MLKIYTLLVVFLLLSTSLALKKPGAKRGGKTKNDTPKRVILMRTESSINVQLVRATTVEIGFSFIQGAFGFVVSAKEWIDGKFEQSVETDRQLLNVQKRSAILKNLIPGREYLIQVQALGKTKRPFGSIQEKIVRTSQMCYVCNGVESNDECDSSRDAVECPSDKNACLNVVRYDNDQMSVTKRCAQYDARLAAQTSSCGGRDGATSKVCKCMCRSNLCNNLMLPCVDECMDELPIPMRSVLKCTNGRKLGSVCRWECPAGYILKGLKESKCRSDRTWSVMSPPQCIHKADPVIRPTPAKTTPVRPRGPSPRPKSNIKPVVRKVCRPLSEPRGVDVKCTNGVRQNSVCTVTCRDGFTKEGGSTTRVCNKAKWSGTAIMCREVLCPAVSTFAGFVNCSDERKIGSVCNFAKQTTMTCKQDGSWESSGECPTVGLHDIKAQISGCEPLPTPSYGAIKCSNEFNEESVCKYSCANGYTMMGETQLRTCEKGQWTGSPVVCEEIKCGDLVSESYVRSVVKCSDDNKIGSVCDVITPSQVTCQADGSWSLPFKQAEKCKECKCP